jgi:hypothetical protein
MMVNCKHAHAYPIAGSSTVPLKRTNIVVRNPIAFLSTIVETVYGDAQVSFEGNLSQLDLRNIAPLATKPTDLLPRNTLQPELDFVILPVEADTKDVLVQHILPRIGLRTRVVHVEFAKAGKIVMAAYDNFDPDCV